MLSTFVIRMEIYDDKQAATDKQSQIHQHFSYLSLLQIVVSLAGLPIVLSTLACQELLSIGIKSSISI